jgi:hypothetical protein
MKSSSTNNNNKKFHLIINGDKRSSYLFVIATIPVLVGITGAFWDLTYHALNKVDTFFQPAHLVIYNSIFAALLIGFVIALKTRYNLPKILLTMTHQITPRNKQRRLSRLT